VEVGAWRGKRAAEAARADEADAANVRLMAELDAARLQLQVHMNLKNGWGVNGSCVLSRIGPGLPSASCWPLGVH
jgi:hypothetical protein